MNHHYVVIMAGGNGTRLWPLSRQRFPKQFLPLVENNTLLQSVVADVRLVLPEKQIYVMADAKKVALARKQLKKFAELNFITEPAARDNGPAVALATLLLCQRDPEAVVTVLWSDHFVQKKKNFAAALKSAWQRVQENPEHLISIGVKPTYPATSFGYIKIGHELLAKSKSSEPAFAVDKFVEKPDFKTAEKYVGDWRYLWNTGYKTFRAAHLLNLWQKHQPKDWRHLKVIAAALGTPKEKAATKKDVINQEFLKLTKKDIERLITEKTKQILVIPADLGWSDIGAWNSLHDLLAESSGEDLVIKTEGEHIGINNHRCLVIGKKKLIATIGLTDIVIVETDDALLVAHKSAAQDVKKVIAELEEKGKHHFL